MKGWLQNWNPLEIFEKLFDNQAFDLLVNQRILYARQQNKHDFFVTAEEMEIFVGVLLYSGYHKLPQQRMYWSLDKDLGVEIISKSMSRNRFLEIKRYLHLANNDNVDKNDKMFKLRPRMDIQNKNFRQWGIFHKILSVGQAMIKYFGHHPSKQFIRGKPVRFGFKDWKLCSSTGYCYAFETYYCMNNKKKEESLGLGPNVVIALLEHLTNPDDHVVHFDNFFTTLNIMNKLKPNVIDNYFKQKTLNISRNREQSLLIC